MVRKKEKNPDFFVRGGWLATWRMRWIQQQTALCGALCAPRCEGGGSPLNKGSRGQAFSTMKILIGAVLATALLVMVNIMMSQTNLPYPSQDAIKDLLRQAQNGQGLCFPRENVQFLVGEDLSTFGVSAIVDNADILDANEIVKKKTISSVLVTCTGTGAGTCTIKIGAKC